MLYLGYHNTEFTDGAGAQLQRILGIYSVSRLLGCGYLHFGLKEIGYQGLSVLETGNEIPHLADCYNRLVSLPSDAEVSWDFGDQIFAAKSPGVLTILKLRLKSMIRRRHALLLMQMPYAVADVFPRAYAAVRGVISESAGARLAAEAFSAEFNRQNEEQIAVAVHVRRGELFAVDSHRMLPNSYYISVCNRIAELLTRANKSFRFDLYTEMPRTALTVHGHSHGIDHRIDDSIEISPEELRLSEFDGIANIRYRINEHPVSTLFNLASADVLVASRSSYSYVAAVAGTVKCVVCPRFWHALMPGWAESDPETGYFDSQKLVAAMG